MKLYFHSSILIVRIKKVSGNIGSCIEKKFLLKCKKIIRNIGNERVSGFIFNDLMELLKV